MLALHVACIIIWLFPKISTAPPTTGLREVEREHCLRNQIGELQREVGAPVAAETASATPLDSQSMSTTWVEVVGEPFPPVGGTRGWVWRPGGQQPLASIKRG
jgi:hypothetical protein